MNPLRVSRFMSVLQPLVALISSSAGWTTAAWLAAPPSALRQEERRELLQSSKFAGTHPELQMARTAQRTSVGSATQTAFISCSEVHNIKGHALMIRYPGNSKARRENYTYPTSNIWAKMKVISVELGREITLWIYQWERVQFFFLIVIVNLCLWRWWWTLRE